MCYLRLPGYKYSWDILYYRTISLSVHASHKVYNRDTGAATHVLRLRCLIVCINRTTFHVYNEALKTTSELAFPTNFALV